MCIRPPRCSVLSKSWPVCPQELAALVQSRGHGTGMDTAFGAGRVTHTQSSPQECVPGPCDSAVPCVHTLPSLTCPHLPILRPARGSTAPSPLLTLSLAGPALSVLPPGLGPCPRSRTTLLLPCPVLSPFSRRCPAPRRCCSSTPCPCPTPATGQRPPGPACAAATRACASRSIYSCRAAPAHSLGRGSG